MIKSWCVGSLVAIFFCSGLTAAEATLPVVADIEAQPLFVHVQRLREALTYLGTPLSDADSSVIDEALRDSDEQKAIRSIQQVLDRYCLAGVQISPESRVKVLPGPARPELDQGGWRQYLVKVQNDAGVTAPLRVQSPQALPVHNAKIPGQPRHTGASPDDVDDRWLDCAMFDQSPLTAALTGIGLEYRILQLYSRDAGKRAAILTFDVGQATQDLGFRSDITLYFDAHLSRAIPLRVLDTDGAPTTAGFVIRDRQNRVYPSQAKRLAPDFAFHPQVYRADGETITLPAGTYTIEVTRGPEYVPQTRTVDISNAADALTFELERWIDPSELGWWSGDHHIHAAGCSHYSNPNEGVLPSDMAKHCLGEDLKVGCNLTWGPCFDYQKQFFTGQIDAISRPPYLLRYDVEVSGFGSHQSGHLCLLGLTTQIPPGGDSKDHWPTLGLNTLRWAKRQGAVCGPAHSGWGLKVDSRELPNYEIPPYDSIGANEYIVDVTHTVEGPDGSAVPAVDFMSAVDTPYVWELNMWYHTLNCGFRTRLSGETDFPCIYGKRVGMGRSYVKLDGPIDFDAWVEGLRQGRCYVSDGMSHLMEMQVNGVALGTSGSEVHLDAPGPVELKVLVSAMLPDQPDEAVRSRAYDEKPFWHLEKARIDDSRDVLVEVVVNGEPVAQQRIAADGQARDLLFEVPIQRSSWVAARVLPSSHTNPVFILVGDEPIRASRRSAEWCLAGVDACWSQKERFIADDEMDDALEAYEHARQAYKSIIADSYDDR